MGALTNASPMGRRERKKQATRRALQDAALQLAVEHGPDQVTVEAICRLADVAPRTFFNYFSGKDEALAGDGPPLPDEETWEKFEAGGSGDMWEDLRAILSGCAHEIAPRRQEFMKRRKLMEQYPAMLQWQLSHFAKFEDRMIRAIARRSGTDEKDVYPQLAAGVAAMAMKVSMRRWARAKSRRSPQPYVDDTFAVLRDSITRRE
ncbi:MAG: TetR family transcriptional regulator [Acidothermales bacterium]|nr:TetR family transcriptional regulator [Acidothermales bacterium]